MKNASMKELQFAKKGNKGNLYCASCKKMHSSSHAHFKYLKDKK